MSTTTKENPKTKVTTGKVRFSFVHVWEPTQMTDERGQPTGKPKYSVSILIPKTDETEVKRINAAIEAAKEDGIKSKFGGKLPPNLKMPLRDGDTERPENPEYKGHWFVNASTSTPPGVVGRNPKIKITDQSEFYSGVYGKASINFYAFNKAGNKGIACGLNHVQKLEDGEPLGGRGDAENDFVDEGDLDSLTG